MASIACSIPRSDMSWPWYRAIGVPGGMPVAARIRSGAGVGGVQTSGQFMTIGGRGTSSCFASRSA